MCGIAGYSLAPGRESSGRSPRRRCSRRSPSAAPTRSATPIAAPARSTRPSSSSGRRRRSCSSGSPSPERRTELLVHVRDYTKGHPSIAANNHPGPPRPGRRDPQRDHRQRRRAARRALLRPRRAADDGRLRGDLRARGALATTTRGRSRASAARWRRPGSTSAEPEVALPRARRRPAAVARRVPRRLFFASTEHALEVVERYCGVRSCASARCDEGTLLAVHDGAVVRRERFRPTATTPRHDPLPGRARHPASATSACSAARDDRRRAEPSSAASRRGATSHALARAAARARGTGTSPRRRGAPRTCR